ncbi:sigma-70 family RNA polymerase sigma factor (plasmid) [Paenibacillus peoriae]|uniref:Sigma-70 family RNA polymerase sigma factor n=1 Tax=Paenibacillus peoriae TaxID=59893 RepID=A0A7H0YHE1_9BACL|nr:sigma-70 family RNA polymerase sigma factor [Paenibacillus peoriae]QNR70499.1 sigma-70 family RNA polymerase sigma factor [Paenibacillus peoriae]
MAQNINVALDLVAIQPIFDFELFKVKAQDQEDVKQNAIVQILTSLADPRYVVTEDTLFSFAQRIVQRTVADYYRKKYRMIEVNSTSVHFVDAVDEETGEGGSNAFNYKVEDFGYQISELRVDYRMYKQDFSPQERKVIDYLLYNGDAPAMQMKEITDLLGIDKSHGSRAFHKLRNLANRSEACA